MLVALGSLQPWPGWNSMVIVAPLHELLLLLHVPSLHALELKILEEAQFLR
jgi:hypothetical protein